MEALIVLALIFAGIVWLVSPFLTLARLSGIASEIQELKQMLKIQELKQMVQQRQSPAVKETDVGVQAVVEAACGEEKQPESEPVVDTAPEPHPEESCHEDESIHASEMPPQESLPATGEEHRPQPTYEPTALDVFWSRVEDWLAVRGDFAPAGMTREFAIATRWLVRTGTLILVGAIAYFLVLAIDKGWIGPVQRVYGMMFWGAVGIVAGTWIKLKKENYAILGEVFLALGLVALYLSFGLGHRFFKPPVIESYVVTFAGLVAATVLAGGLSVRLRSLPIAVLGLAGGVLVPLIVHVGTEPIRLDAYLLMLALGACIVAHVRRWTAYGFAAVATVFMVFLWHDVDHGGMANGVFMSVLYLLVPALTLAGADRRSQAGHNLCWVFVTGAALAWTFSMRAFCFVSMAPWDVGGVLAAASVVHASLAALSRCRRWQVGAGVSVLMCLAVGFAAFALLSFLEGHEQWRLPSFCLFAAVLAELHARSGERAFGALSLLVAVVCLVVGMYVIAPESYQAISPDGYGHALLVRSVRLWCVPALAAFLGWRLNEEKMGFPYACAICHVMAVITGLALLTCESHWLGKLFLPALRGGTVTIAWAVVALFSLSFGIVCRRRLSRLVGLWLLAIVVVKLLLFDTSSLPTPGRVGVFGLVGVVLIACAFLYLKFKSKFEVREMS